MRRKPCKIGLCDLLRPPSPWWSSFQPRHWCLRTKDPGGTFDLVHFCQCFRLYLFILYVASTILISCHIFSILFISFHLLTVKGGDWSRGLPGGSPAAWWRRCRLRPWRPPPQLPRCGRNGQCRRRCWRRWTSPCLSESKCVWFFDYFLSQAPSYDWTCVVGPHQLTPQFCFTLECQTFGSPMMILGHRWFQTISEMKRKSAVAGSQARNTH